MPLILLALPPLEGLLGLLIYLIVFLVIAGLIFWCVQKLSAAFGIPEPIKTVIVVARVVIFVISLLYFLIGGGFPQLK